MQTMLVTHQLQTAPAQHRGLLPGLASCSSIEAATTRGMSATGTRHTEVKVKAATSSMLGCVNFSHSCNPLQPVQPVHYNSKICCRGKLMAKVASHQLEVPTSRAPQHAASHIQHACKTDLLEGCCAAHSAHLWLWLTGQGVAPGSQVTTVLASCAEMLWIPRVAGGRSGTPSPPLRPRRRLPRDQPRRGLRVVNHGQSCAAPGPPDPGPHCCFHRRWQHSDPLCSRCTAARQRLRQAAPAPPCRRCPSRSVGSRLCCRPRLLCSLPAHTGPLGRCDVQGKVADTPGPHRCPCASCCCPIIFNCQHEMVSRQGVQAALEGPHQHRGATPASRPFSL